MNTEQLFEAIKQLPLDEQVLLVEQILERIRKLAIEDQLSIAADSLKEEYKSNSELTAFTDLDLEDFYEAR